MLSHLESLVSRPARRRCHLNVRAIQVKMVFGTMMPSPNELFPYHRIEIWQVGQPFGAPEATADSPSDGLSPERGSKTASRMSQPQVPSRDRAACQRGVPALVLKLRPRALPLSDPCEPSRRRADYNIILNLD